MSTMTRLFETAVITTATLTLATALQRPTVWAFVPLVLLLILRVDPETWGFRLRLSPPPITAQLTGGLTLLVAYSLLHISIAILTFEAGFVPTLPPNPGDLFLHQMLMVAIPEEMFFRGYVQSRLNGAFGRPWHLLGARFGVALPIQAVLFTICHLPSSDSWTHIHVFFFGLLAGWLRDRSGGILLPVIYHAAGNICLAVLVASIN